MQSSFKFVLAGAIAFCLQGCGDDPTSTTTTTPGAIDLPELTVPHCSIGWAVTPFYYIATDHDYLQPATWDAYTQICWDGNGITVQSNNSDLNIFQSCEDCGCDSLDSLGVVAQALLGPVSTPSAVPDWYYHLIAGAIAGAFQGAIRHRPGNDTIYPSSTPCSAVVFGNCLLDCGGLLPEVTVSQGEGWWAHTMVVPWTMFAAEYTPVGNGGQPWPHWRGNFYRRSYPKELPDGTYSQDWHDFERSGWSPGSYEPSGMLAFAPFTAQVSRLVSQ